MTDPAEPFWPVEPDEPVEPDGQATDHDVIEASIVPPTPEPARLWSAFVVATGSILVATVLSVVVFAMALFTIGGVPLDQPPSELDLTETMSRIARHPLGLWALVVPGQLCFFAAAFVAANASPVAVKKRLGLVRGHFPPWSWIIIAIATPAITFLISMLLSSTNSEPSEHLKAMEELVTSQGGARFFITVLLIAVAPGICEELIFRGYLQTRLLERWSPRAAIIASAAIFAVAHLDPMHVFAVFPLGIWLGVVAWRTGSILPAMLCHFASNFFALLVTQLDGDPDPHNLTATDMMIFGPCLLALIVCLTLFVRWKPPRRMEIA